MKKVKVSVIVPVYGAENYIEQCARSLFGQTLDDIEYVIVNDCTIDKSISVLERVLKEYPHRADYVRIVNLEKNGGVANARTVGMMLATGEYTIHCDPDDYVDSDCYETLYNEAHRTNADIVTCDYYREKDDKIEYVTQRYGSTPRKSIENFYEYPFFPSLWSALIRTSIIHVNQIYPYPGINTGEDLNVIFRIFLKAETLSYIHKAFYHYVQRNGSLTQKSIEELWDKNIAPNLVLLSSFLDNQRSIEIQRTKHYLQYSKKLMLLQCKKPHWKMWYNTYKECIDSIDYFQSYSAKHKLVMKPFAKHYFLLALYYRILRPMGLKII